MTDRERAELLVALEEPCEHLSGPQFTDGSGCDCDLCQRRRAVIAKLREAAPLRVLVTMSFDADGYDRRAVVDVDYLPEGVTVEVRDYSAVEWADDCEPVAVEYETVNGEEVTREVELVENGEAGGYRRADNARPEFDGEQMDEADNG